MNMKIRAIVFIALAALAGCKNKPGEADAYGNFEATEVLVSSETSGRILQFAAEEGSLVSKGSEIALIDTTLLHLQKAEINAGIRNIRTRTASINAQNEILNQQIANINVNITRVENMLKDDAASKKQYDDLTGQVEVLKKQIAANNTQKASVEAEMALSAARRATVDEQISRSSVKSPIDGTILEKYAEAGEVTAAGKPLVKIADLALMKLKVYVSGGQVGSLRIGNKCKVRIDNGARGFTDFEGAISYISGKAEFTPKVIQTKEERVAFVYAVTINVVNDGSLKSGMPGEALFK
jgi:HlyD family secretion protein